MGTFTVQIAAAKLQGYLQATVQIAHKIFARDRANSNCLLYTAIYPGAFFMEATNFLVNPYYLDFRLKQKFCT